MNSKPVNLLRKPLAIAIAGVFSLGLMACDQKPSAEQVGQNIDHSIDRAGQQIAQATDKVENKMNQASSAISDTAASAGTTITDAAITTTVKTALLAEPDLKSTGIKVVTEKGVVNLTGTVASHANRERAARLAGAIEGVKTVDNKLTVVPGS